MRLLFIFLLLPVKLFSQDVTGVWVGTLYNDTTRKYIPYEIAITGSKGKLSGFSHTIFSGENNRQETGVKSLKIKQRTDKILIEDDALLYNNYTEPAPKGVRQFSTLNVVQADSGLFLIGVFNTNRTKEYASLTGSIRLRKKEKILESMIVPSLEAMNLFSSLSFAQPPQNDVAASVLAKTTLATTGRAQQKREVTLPVAMKDSQQVTLQDKPKKIDNTPPVLPTALHKDKNETGSVAKTRQDEKKDPVKNEKKEQPLLEQNKFAMAADIKNSPAGNNRKDTVMVAAKDEKKSTPLLQEKQSSPAVAYTKSNPAVNVKKEIAMVATQDEKTSKPAPLQKQAPARLADIKKELAQNVKKEAVIVPVKTPTGPLPATQQKKQETVTIPMVVTPPGLQQASNVKPDTKTTTVAQLAKEKEKEETKHPISAVSKNLIQPDAAISAEQLAKRKIETIRSVEFTSDSLVLTLYDNGEVDGDTVSVILNGNTIMAKQRLTEKALSKTIYITPQLGDSLQLIMFAENLGSIPPNTGLLIIQDGQERYQIRFEGDLRKNAAITLRKKARQ